MCRRTAILCAAARRDVCVHSPGQWPEGKLKKAERELLSYLELHPGSHNLAEVDEAVERRERGGARAGQTEAPHARSGSPDDRVLSLSNRRPTLNRHQQVAFEAIRAAWNRKQFQAFLLQGVTGSGKTEVYLRSIEATLASGRNALLLVPEIALTPAVAGQFFHRFGDQVAILHSAFHDSERAEQWRRIRTGHARVVVGYAVGRIRSGAESRPDHHR